MAHGAFFSSALEPGVLIQCCSVTSQWWQEIGHESIYTPLKSANATNRGLGCVFFSLLGDGCQTFTSLSLVLIILPLKSLSN